jgi:hypothetical protein
MMDIEVVDSWNVLIRLEGKFTIMIGTGEESLFLCSHLWLITGVDRQKPIKAEAVHRSGVSLACTYPFKYELPSQLVDTARVFTAYNEVLNLPYGWKVCPVSSGTGWTNWYFSHPQSRSVLVCGPTSVTKNCIYRNRAENLDVGVLVNTSGPSKAPTSTQELISMITRVSDSVVNISVSDECTAVALAVRLSSGLGKANLVRISSDDPNFPRRLKRVPSLFEWLSEDFQLYLRKCVKFACDRNQELDIFSPVGDVQVSSEPSALEKLVINIDPSASDMFRIVGESSPSEVAEFYSAQTVISSGSHEVVRVSTDSTVERFSKDKIVKALNLRFPDVIGDGSSPESFRVASLDSSVTLDDEGRLCSFSFSDCDIRPLLYLVI